MAKFRPVDPLAPPASDRQPMQTSDGATMMGDYRDVDSWAMVRGGEVEQSSATSSEAVQTATKHKGLEADVATPIPIGCWKVISPNGREERVFKPIPGFEHLFNGPAQPQRVSRPEESPGIVVPPVYQPVVSQVPATPREDQTKKRKRTRPQTRARGRPSQAVAWSLSEDDDDEQHYDGDVTALTAKPYTFYIGDVHELKRFFRRRLDELTMKPVRPIVTAWVKLLEPKRLARFGPYHKKLPHEQPQKCTPPWWPRDVPYEEPSHLDKDGLLTLAVDLMLQHRNIDMFKRTMDWASKLRTAAHYAVEATPPDQFSSSKGSAFSERMQARALDEIIPNLFDVAQLYQEHLARYSLYEGTNNRDPGIGKHVTWQPLTRPPRHAPGPRKRLRQTNIEQPPRIDYDAHDSGQETEVDNTTTESHLRLQGSMRDPRQQTHVPVHGPPALHAQHMHAGSSTTTPSTSFGQSMHAPHPSDDMDLDVKHVPYQDQTLGQSNFHYHQPMQFSASQQSYCPVFQAQQVVGDSSGVIPASTCLYEQPFSLFPAFHPHAEISTSSDSAGFPYYHDIFAPSVFVDLRNVNSASCHPEASHN
ncbi:hypothetical protein ACET3X_008691 [Alternaria dauci]|uniref:Subtelomeric hrmA-associated cluster protein AFUB-079030/YDR124W-like helical bundle domain-containing protein n=1 Tax=Alternaria dauci TaxID=48095 RepID=A0ABR3UD09_9PLEO